jgi:hypothetical protein
VLLWWGDNASRDRFIPGTSLNFIVFMGAMLILQCLLLYCACQIHIEGFGLSDNKGDIELYTSYDKEKFADSEYVYNSISP